MNREEAKTEAEEILDSHSVEMEGLNEQFDRHPNKIYSFVCFATGFLSLLMTQYSAGFYIPTVLGVLASYYFSRQVEWEDEGEEVSEE